jgi:hypothetical protein
MCACVVLCKKVHRSGLSTSDVLCPLFFVHCPFNILCPIVRGRLHIRICVRFSVQFGATDGLQSNLGYIFPEMCLLTVVMVVCVCDRIFSGADVPVDTEILIWFLSRFLP